MSKEIEDLTDMQITEELAYYLKDTAYRTNMSPDVYKHMVNLIAEQQGRIKEESDKEIILTEIQAELSALGQFWRNDWSEFDGRSLRDDMDNLIEEIKDKKISTELRDQLKAQEESW